MSEISNFKPAVDGWRFTNFGSTGLSWELFRRTYLAINPTQNCVEAPTDCAFYEFFKVCAGPGNCGGMSLLDLALHKYGSYMGFCSPACFYTGTDSPDRPDLREVINILQGRQFGAAGIQNFLDVSKAGNLNDAQAAFKVIEAHIGSQDYCVICLNNGLAGAVAHTLIPYRLEEQGGKKYIYVCDPNLPGSVYPDYYANGHNRIEISGPADWDYDQGSGAGNNFSNGTHYQGSTNGWCFAVPMSLVLPKTRHPLSVGFIISGLTALFVAGTGAAVVQIEDDEGHRLYAHDAGPHVRSDEFETSPSKRLPDIGRWPWLALGDLAQSPGELYFIRGPVSSAPLAITISGSKYRLIYLQQDTLTEFEVVSGRPARDRLRIAGLATSAPSLEIRTGGETRTIHARHLRTSNDGASWKSVTVKNAILTNDQLKVQVTRDLQYVDVSGAVGEVSFELELEQYAQANLATRNLGKFAATGAKILRFAPEDWARLEHTEINVSGA